MSYRSAGGREVEECDGSWDAVGGGIQHYSEFVWEGDSDGSTGTAWNCWRLSWFLGADYVPVADRIMFEV